MLSCIYIKSESDKKKAEEKRKRMSPHFFFFLKRKPVLKEKVGKKRCG
jgi:hypothetical protein